MVLPRQRIHSLHIVIPFYGLGTMERVEREGVLASAEPAAKIIAQSIPASLTSIAEVSLVDIHALTERFFFSDGVRVSLLSALPFVLSSVFTPLPDEFAELHAPGRIRVSALAFPDEGAYKRFIKVIEAEPQWRSVPILIFGKVREGDKRIVTFKECLHGDRRDVARWPHTVVVVDDLVQSGGTLFECAEAILRLGARSVSAYVAHAVFPKDSWRKFVRGQPRGVFDHFVVTNSNPSMTSQLEGVAPFRVVDISAFLWSEVFTARTYHPVARLPAASVVAAVGSVSQVKLAAVYWALRDAYNNAPPSRAPFFLADLAVLGCDSDSGVPPQPIGEEEARRGAANRLDHVLRLARASGLRLDLAVAVESGIVPRPEGRFLDVAFVEAEAASPDGAAARVSLSSAELEPRAWVPAAFVEASTRDHKQLRTAGQLMSERFGWSDADWHAHVIGCSRTNLIARTLLPFFDSAIARLAPRTRP